MSTQRLLPEHGASLLGLLSQTLNHDPTVRLPAEQQLEQWAKVPGFITLLYSIVANGSIDHTLRLLAVIALKNQVEKSWRMRREGAIGEDEKAFLRANVLDLLNDSNNQRVLQVAVLISKIARTDFPNVWPDVLDKLITGVQRNSVPNNVHYLLALYYVIKQLFTKCLPENRRTFQRIAPGIFAFVTELLKMLLNQIFNALATFSRNEIGNDQLEKLKPEAETCKLCLKLISPLILHGYAEFHKDQAVMEYLAQSLSMIKTIAACRTSVPPNALSRYLDLYLVRATKAIIECNKKSIEGFSLIAVPFVEFFYEQISLNTAASSSDAAFEKFLVHAFNFNKEILSWVNSTDNNPPARAIFTADKLKEFTQIIISKYLILSAFDLQDWEQDPEKFFADQECTSKLRSTAENMYQMLLTYDRNTVAQIVVQLLQQILQPQQGGTDWLLLKEACYASVCVGYNTLFEFIPFPSFFANHLLPDLSIQEPGYHIIRKRIADIIGSWVSEISDEMRGTVYRILVTLMGESDIVVSLAAVSALRYVIDDCKFYPEPFAEFLQPAIERLFAAINRVDEMDTKLRILNTISVLLDQVGEMIYPYNRPIMTCLADLWKNSQDYNLMKSAILRALKRLVKSLDNGAMDFYGFLLPVIKYSTDLEQPESIYLMEDGLSLWIHTIKQALALDPQLLTLYPNVTALFQSTVEHLKPCLKITEAYLLVAKDQFLFSYVSAVSASLLRVVGEVRESGTKLIMKLIGLMVEMFPQAIPPHLDKIFEKMLFILLNNKETDDVAIHYYTVFARLLIVNPDYFFAFFQAMTASPNNPTKSNLLLLFLDAWLDKIDNMTDTLVRKLTAMALCTLLPSREPDILYRMGQIINVCIDVLLDIESSIRKYGYDFFLVSSESDGDLGQNLYSRERQSIYQRDPVNTTDLRAFVIQKLTESSTVNGQLFHTALQNVDPVILSQLQTMQKPPEPTRKLNDE